MTEAELFDHLQRTFGAGNWDEATATVPWWKFRGREIAKLKSMMKKRGATAAQVIAAAEYAVAHRTSVRETYQLFELIPEAMREKRLLAQRPDTVDLDTAIAQAVEAGETAWADRLMRSSGAEANTVIEQWRNR